MRVGAHSTRTVPDNPPPPELKPKPAFGRAPRRRGLLPRVGRRTPRFARPRPHGTRLRPRRGSPAPDPQLRRRSRTYSRRRRRLQGRRPTSRKRSPRRFRRGPFRARAVLRRRGAGRLLRGGGHGAGRSRPRRDGRLRGVARRNARPARPPIQLPARVRRVAPHRRRPRGLPPRRPRPGRLDARGDGSAAASATTSPPRPEAGPRLPRRRRARRSRGLLRGRLRRRSDGAGGDPRRHAGVQGVSARRVGGRPRRGCRAARVSRRERRERREREFLQPSNLLPLRSPPHAHRLLLPARARRGAGGRDGAAALRRAPRAGRRALPGRSVPQRLLERRQVAARARRSRPALVSSALASSLTRTPTPRASRCRRRATPRSTRSWTPRARRSRRTPSTC